MENFLPHIPNIPKEFRKGRCIYDGYARGWGLQFGDLRQKILADDLYQRAVHLAMGRSIQSEMNRMNIYLLLKFFIGKLPFGHVTEFGAYKGGSALFMAKVCAELHPGMQVYAFDTFCGMPETDKGVDAHNANDFKDCDLENLREFAAQNNLTNLHFVKGLFQDSVPGILPQMGGLRLIHIDCDIYSACCYTYEITKPYMVPGGYVVLDDALFSSCLGATEAVEELIIRRDGLNSEQVFPHYVFRSKADQVK